MQVRGNCTRCKGPIFLNQTMDWYGNTVVTIGCWNGHYSWVNVEGLEEEEARSVPVNPRLNVVEQIGFFNLA